MTQRTAIAFVHPLLTWVCEKACIQQSSAATSNINHYFNNDFFCSYHSLLNYANWSENGMFHAYVNHMNVACQSMANKNAMLIRNLTEEKNRFSFFFLQSCLHAVWALSPVRHAYAEFIVRNIVFSIELWWHKGKNASHWQCHPTMTAEMCKMRSRHAEYCFFEIRSNITHIGCIQLTDEDTAPKSILVQW